MVNKLAKDISNEVVGIRHSLLEARALLVKERSFTHDGVNQFRNSPTPGAG